MPHPNPFLRSSPADSLPETQNPYAPRLPGMSPIQRRQLLAERTDQLRRETNLNKRALRQLDRSSRKGNVKATLGAIEQMDRMQGRGIAPGTTSFEQMQTRAGEEIGRDVAIGNMATRGLVDAAGGKDERLANFLTDRQRPQQTRIGVGPVTERIATPIREQQNPAVSPRGFSGDSSNRGLINGRPTAEALGEEPDSTQDFGDSSGNRLGDEQNSESPVLMKLKSNLKDDPDDAATIAKIARALLDAELGGEPSNITANTLSGLPPETAQRILNEIEAVRLIRSFRNPRPTRGLDQGSTAGLGNSI